MPTLQITTRIKAPVERVFDLARSIDLHLESAMGTKEKVVEGPSTGLQGLDEVVTWEGSNFSFRQSLSVKITKMERPLHFTEEMVSGPFARMSHRYLFEDSKGETIMNEEFEYKSRGGPIGWIIENSFLTAHLRRFFAERNKIIREVAESEDWKKYLPDEQ